MTGPPSTAVMAWRRQCIDPELRSIKEERSEAPFFSFFDGQRFEVHGCPLQGLIGSLGKLVVGVEVHTTGAHGLRLRLVDV